MDLNVSLTEITTMHRNRKGADPWRRLAAAHELGHYWACRWAGYATQTPRVWGSGEGVAGVTMAESGPLRTTEQMRVFILTYMAGPAAGRRWGGQVGEAMQQRYMCRSDEAAVRRALRHLLANDLSHAQLHRQAERLVDRYWDQIVEGVPHLAKHGSM